MKTLKKMVIKWFSTRIFMAVWFWLVLGVFTTVYIALEFERLTYRREALALLASSALFIGPYFFGRKRGLGQARRCANEHVHRRVRPVHARRHRQVGQRGEDLGGEG